MATSPATMPDAAPSVVGLPSRMRSTSSQREHGGGRRDGRGHEGATGGAVRAGRRTGVEPEPAEPQQSGTEHHERHVVRAEQRRRPALALAQHDRQGQARHTGVDMDRCPSGEVDRVQLVVDPAAVLGRETVSREDPVRDREVDDRRPECGEHQPGAELQPVGHRARDQGDGDDREHQLEGHEDGRRHRPGQRDVRRGTAATRLDGVAADEALQAPVVARFADDSPLVVTERHGIAVEHPQHGHDAHCADAHHDHVEYASGTNHAAVEERQSRRHQQHQRGTRQHPGGIARIWLA